MEEEAARQELVAGKYRITRLIGRGGMGTVWEGVHATLSTRVAIKFIDSDHTQNAELRNRFANEARAAARLRTKHVVQVLDHGVHDDGRSYIVMEFLSGESLDHRLERLGRLSPEETSRIVLQVCRALTKAHAAGIVHRDLKPENIFLVWDEEDCEDIVKVVDFGIAKFTDAAASASSATRTGAMLGTPFYMSPEQARGLRTVDFRTDLWSLGVVAYECIVGALPFDGVAVGDLVVKICTASLPIPSQVASDVPSGFDAWFARALQREPEQRFSSATELGEALALACGVPLTGGAALNLSAANGSSGRGQAGAISGSTRRASGVRTPDPDEPRPPNGVPEPLFADVPAVANTVVDARSKPRIALWVTLSALLILVGGVALYLVTRAGDAGPSQAAPKAPSETAEPSARAERAAQPDPAGSVSRSAASTQVADAASKAAADGVPSAPSSEPAIKESSAPRRGRGNAPARNRPRNPEPRPIDLGY